MTIKHCKQTGICLIQADRLVCVYDVWMWNELCSVQFCLDATRMSKQQFTDVLAALNYGGT